MMVGTINKRTLLWLLQAHDRLDPKGRDGCAIRADVVQIDGCGNNLNVVETELLCLRKYFTVAGY
jgi:hypothetical protein